MLQGLWPKRIIILVVLSVLVIAASTIFKAAVELEDAEQAYYSQWLRWGYDDQPPLYTWIQYFFNQVLGFNKLSFSFLRGIIFGGILLLLYQFAKKMHKDVQKAGITVFMMVLIPVFIDFTFRRLSHTSLLCFSILATYLILERLLTKKTVWNYILFGVCIAFGLLSKYNYVLFLSAFAIVVLFDGQLRKVVFNGKILATILLAMVLVAPHFYWLFGPNENWSMVRESIQDKTGDGTADYLLGITPVILIIKGLIALMAPLLLVFLVLVLLKKVTLQRSKWDWFSKLFVVQILILLLFFLLVKAQKVEVRWLLPLLLPFIILWAKSFQFENIIKIKRYAFVTFIVIIGFQFLRTPMEKVLGIPSSVHFGFEPISNILRQNYSGKEWVLPNVTYAGNIKLLNPNRLIISNDDFSFGTSINGKNRVFVYIGKIPDECRKPTDSILGFGREKDTLFFVPNLNELN
ncbi:ArnT family glycosyltransferase [Maribacter algicola]|uniref:ArnT family glycosyltransferase n=1 Tax=Maribacter algicola TaxID=2498892 RepID=UPI001403EEC5|nr:glycosyltransferase family 39 protein [Maribacter algicola]